MNALYAVIAFLLGFFLAAFLVTFAAVAAGKKMARRVRSRTLIVASEACATAAASIKDEPKGRDMLQQLSDKFKSLSTLDKFVEG